MNPDEIWKSVAENPGYEVSNLGQIRTLRKTVRRGKIGFRVIEQSILKPRINTVGYFIVNLWNRSVQKTYMIHRLVAKAFIENPEAKPCVNHRDGNYLNDRAENLEWVTSRENSTHAIEILGHHNRGENHGIAKLTDAQVIEIRRRRANGEKLQPLADDFGTCNMNISLICRRKAWKHVA